MKLQDFDFRIWNNNAKKYEADCIINSLGFIESVFRQLTYEKPLLDYEIELWTGFCDKNGKKIYDGDVIFLDDEDIGKNKGIIIKRKSGEYRIEFASNNTLGLNTLGLKRLNQENLLILGNIHENAELLNENKPS